MRIGLRQRNAVSWRSVALTFFVMVFCYGGNAAAESSIDTRILIDVSGSMKQNDPKNLRRPALRLLVGLLPTGSRAGVWTFGRYVNMQIPLGSVNDAWRKKGRTEAGKIGWPGQFTNIEGVLRRSTEDWKGSDKKEGRHVILLTDGVVDISKNAKKNRSSRKRILGEVLTHLKQVGANVHTIALSERADHELLKELAVKTGGWYEQINEADQLNRIFLRIFEKVGKPDAVPLDGNRFKVDGSIRETTLLIFKAPDAGPTKIIDPKNQEYTAENVPKNITWHQEGGYDLLTINQPRAGEWTVQADMDPDNRVMVVTDLKMVATKLPNRVVEGEQIPLSVRFEDRGETITHPSFLDVVEVLSKYSDAAGSGISHPLLDNGEGEDQQDGDGVFTQLLGEEFQPGVAQLALTAESKTFSRERRYTFEVLSAANVVTREDAKGSALITVHPAEGMIEVGSVQLAAQLTHKEQGGQPVLFIPAADGVSQESVVDLGDILGEAQLPIHMKALSTRGNPIEIDLPPVTLIGSAPPPVEKSPVVEAPKPAQPVQPKPPVVDTPPVEPEKKETTPEAAPETEEEGVPTIWLLFGLMNLILVAGVAVLFWILLRRKQGDQVVLDFDEEDEKASPPAQKEEKSEAKETTEVASAQAEEAEDIGPGVDQEEPIQEEAIQEEPAQEDEVEIQETQMPAEGGQESETKETSDEGEGEPELEAVDDMGLESLEDIIDSESK